MVEKGDVIDRVKALFFGELVQKEGDQLRGSTAAGRGQMVPCDRMTMGHEKGCNGGGTWSSVWVQNRPLRRSTGA
jgi:hypothetical protein